MWLVRSWCRMRRQEAQNLHKTIPWPLGKERKRNNDTHSATISRRLEQGSPTNIRCYIFIKINCRFDFLEFVLHERINAVWRRWNIVQNIRMFFLVYLRIPVSVVVCQRLESLVFPKFEDFFYYKKVVACVIKKPYRPLLTSQRGDSGTNQIKNIWITEGKPWRAEGIRHAQLVGIRKVPKVYNYIWAMW